MEEYLVRSHLGGYYISGGDPEFIEQYCEQCGDYDMILTSWNSEEENAKLNALLRYFVGSVINTKEDLDERVEAYSELEDMEKKEIIPAILYDIEADNEDICNTINSLYETKDISEQERDRIVHIANFNKERQINMVHKFASSYFSKDEKGNVKVLKKSH